MTQTQIAKPKLWKYVLSAVVVLLILIPVWIYLLGQVIQPASLMNEEITMKKVLLWCVVMPLSAVAVVWGWRWHVASTQAQEAQGRATTVAQITAAANAITLKDYARN